MRRLSARELAELIARLASEHIDARALGDGRLVLTRGGGLLRELVEPADALRLVAT